MKIGNDILTQYNLNSSPSTAKADKIEDTLNGDLKNATDEELMDVCKSFESYMVEQVFKEMRKSIPETEKVGNEYVDYFGDTLYQEYASDLVESGGLGIAQMLYESMKRG